MIESEPAVHPLFDPRSLYGRMRAAVRPEDKMRGYFHWLQARAERVAEAFQAVPPCSPEVLDRLSVRLESLEIEVGVRPGRAEVLAAHHVMPLALARAPSRLEVSRVTLRPGDHEADLLLVRESGGGRSFGMLMSFPEEVCGGLLRRCRAFLCEPEVVKHLRLALDAAATSPTGEVLFQAFQPEAVADNVEVARLLSALPELDGIIHPPGEARFHRHPIPDGCSQFPPRPAPLSVVVVIDHAPFTS
jgi:hypothetical protein